MEKLVLGVAMYAGGFDDVSKSVQGTHMSGVATGLFSQKV